MPFQNFQGWERGCFLNNRLSESNECPELTPDCSCESNFPTAFGLIGGNQSGILPYVEHAMVLLIQTSWKNISVSLTSTFKGLLTAQRYPAFPGGAPCCFLSPNNRQCQILVGSMLVNSQPHFSLPNCITATLLSNNNFLNSAKRL